MQNWEAFWLDILNLQSSRFRCEPQPANWMIQLTNNHVQQHFWRRECIGIRCSWTKKYQHYLSEFLHILWAHENRSLHCVRRARNRSNKIHPSKYWVVHLKLLNFFECQINFSSNLLWDLWIIKHFKWYPMDILLQALHCSNDESKSDVRIQMDPVPGLLHGKFPTENLIDQKQDSNPEVRKVSGLTATDPNGFEPTSCRPAADSACKRLIWATEAAESVQSAEFFAPFVRPIWIFQAG